MPAPAPISTPPDVRTLDVPVRIPLGLVENLKAANRALCQDASRAKNRSVRQIEVRHKFIGVVSARKRVAVFRYEATEEPTK